MATATYEPIAATTLGSAAASITFNSIAATWTDLRLVFVVTMATSGDAKLTMNGDSGSNYSITSLGGNGTSPVSGRRTSQTYIYLDDLGSMSTSVPTMNTVDFMAYAGNTYKTILTTTSSDTNGSGWVERGVALWRSTAAISTVTITATSQFAAGTTATLYGIKAA